MKKIVLWWSVVVLLLLAGGAWAADIALTTIGQSPDAVMVKVLLKRLGVEAVYEPLLKAEALGAEKVLIAVVGGSTKGLGAAGINADDEKARTVSLLDAAKGKGLHILVMHVGGEGRRGSLSDVFIQTAVPYGEEIILVQGANADGLFTKLAGTTPLVEVASVSAAQGPLGDVLKRWHVMP